ncbi:TraB/GumN family protein [Polaribacter sp. HL-MS24]|uniref:TraB/GumN family protein n=1 Tax=Polaribacter sp. HL-MS24 TaxID=3077735 RepID=UPI00293427B4|nr:TraB/GumN family protein [Polaribacter sp. HL-MS24]WOC39966.1 TraB/GumN family protein [Polaribacter sp. HL-MS24]
MKKTLLLISILFTITSCFHKEKRDFDKGNLWEITSKKGKTSYLFGTIHLYPKNEIEFPEKIVINLKKCEQLALERDVTDKSEQQKFMNFKIPDFIKETYRVIMSEYGNELVSMESQLINIAQENEIKVTGLESTDEIIEVMKKLNGVKLPKSEFEYDSILKVYKRTLKMYKHQQIGAFKDISPAQITDLVINQRNKNWIDDIINIIENKPTFIAVGMGHLGGKDGLLYLLNKKDYNLKRME